MPFRTHIALLIAGFVLLTALPHRAVAQQGSNPPVSVEAVKTKVARIGMGAKAKATVKLKDGTKIRGYIAQAGQDDFVIRDRKNDSPKTVPYSDVLKVEENRGHSTARNIGIGVAIGVGAFLALIAIAITHLD
ncbi:MAG: hypothetical protein ABJB97_09740 [Acidobacteriota bacterium]